MLTKWLWRLKCEPNSFWAQVIRGLHNLHGDHAQIQPKSRWTVVWKNILKSKDALDRINIPFEEVMQPGESRVRWVSPFVLDGEFCVVALRDRTERATFPVFDGVFPWLKTIPLKSWALCGGKKTEFLRLNLLRIEEL